MFTAPREIFDWCENLAKGTDSSSLEDALNAIPKLDSLADLPAGTRVLVRCDTNVVLDRDGSIVNESRLKSILPTLRFGLRRGWIQIIHGHLGVDGQDSMFPLVRRLGELLQNPVKFLGDWMDDDTGLVRTSINESLNEAPDASIFMLENARRYSLETALWRPGLKSCEALMDRLSCFANSIRENVARIHVNEGFAASNADLSSCLVPLVMDRVALGSYIRQELSGPVCDARHANIVFFSGAKFNKLEDLLSIVQRKKVRFIVAAGLLALPLLCARAKIFGEYFEPGSDGVLAASWLPLAERLIIETRQHGIELLLPSDLVLDDGSVAEKIPADRAQRDIGPRTRAEFSTRLLSYGAKHPGSILFYNGVAGQFEQEQFSHGTQSLISTIMHLHSLGHSVYVGGGEGETALLRWGKASQVTHCFTAGTTILKALGAKPIPYVWALSNATRKQAVRSMKIGV
jgi:phosphoglycerate kinase